jgi:divalent metal cation (Fe/Co/Zn/Cd) transporter
MFSEAIHSVVDTGNQVLMLYGLKRASIPADNRFPFGHGKEIYFWSFAVAIMIFGVGAGLSFYEGVHSLQKPTPLKNPMINYIVLSLAIVFEGIQKTVMSFRGIRHVNDILTMHMGPDYILVNLSVEFNDTADADDIEMTVAKIDSSIRKKYSHVKRIFIEAEARQFKSRV